MATLGMSLPRETAVIREIVSNHSRPREPQLDTMDTVDTVATEDTEDTEATGDPLQLTRHLCLVESRGLHLVMALDPTRLSSLLRRQAQALATTQEDPVSMETGPRADPQTLQPLADTASLHRMDSQGTTPLDQPEA